jgi:hypothetical protein
VLTPDALVILSEAQLKIADFGYRIVSNINKGITSNSRQNDLWNRLVNSSLLFERILTHLVLSEDGTKILKTYEIKDEDLNNLLFCLKQVAQITELPSVVLPIRVYTTDLIGEGNPGIPGQDGKSAFVYVRYAADDQGTNFSSVPNINLPYISVKSSLFPLPDVKESHAGNWNKYLGEDGINGIDGEDGVSNFIFKAYASDDQGADFSYTPSPLLKWIGIIVKPTDVEPLPVEFEGTWQKYIGDDGIDGQDGEQGNTIITVEGEPVIEVGRIGDYAIDKINFLLFGPKTEDGWGIGTNLRGADGIDGEKGNQGEQGETGEAGQPVYMYIAYADNAAGGGYILVQSTDDTAVLSAFNGAKEWIGVLLSSTKIGGSINSDSFANLWVRYRGNGDRWTTSSTTSLTIGSGTKILIVEPFLAYTTGQTVVIADIADFENRMEAYVVSYNAVNGQLITSVAHEYGSGTFNVWAVSLQAFAVDPPITYGGASPTTIAVNDFPIGTDILGKTYDELFENIYAPYAQPVFNSFVITGQTTTLEVGTPIVGAKTFTWTTGNSVNVAADSIKIEDVTANVVLADNLANDGSESLTLSSVTLTSPGTRTWRISANRAAPKTGAITRDFNVAFRYRIHFGTSTNVILNETQIKGLASSNLNVTPAGTLSFVAGGYKYICYADSLGSPAISIGFRDAATNLAVEMASVTDNAAYSNVQNGHYYALISVTNANSVTTNYRVYRTKNILGGSIQILITM